MSEMKHYRLPVDSETGKKLTSLYAAGKKAVEAASKMAKALRATEFEMHPGFAMGGIGALYFRFKPAKRRFDIRDQVNGLHLCFPNTATEDGKQILRRISALPVVKMEQVAEAFGIKNGQVLPDNALLPMFFRVEQQWDYIKTAIDLDIPEMEEVSQEEFEKALKYAEESEV